MTTSFDWDKYAVKAAPEAKAAFDWNKYEKKEAPVKENIGRIAGQVATGLANITPAGIATNLWQTFGTGEALSELNELQERLPQLRKEFPDMGLPENIDTEKYMQAVKAASESVPTPSNIGASIEKATGLPFNPKTDLDRKIRFISEIAGFKGSSLPENIMSGLKGQVATDLLQHAGVPKEAAEPLGLYYGLREVTPKINVTKQATEEVGAAAEKSPGAPPKPPAGGRPPEPEIERLPSGLSKPRAVEAKHINLAKISSESKAAAIHKLDEEASKLAQASVKKHLPISEAIEKGFDFEEHFEKNFGELKSLMERSKFDADITPIMDFFKKTQEKYRGIPSLHPEAVKIIKEIRRFKNNPQTNGGNLLRIYRSNNQKRNQAFETARLTGKQKEYVDFLGDMNRAISDSFERSMPKDGVWLKNFLRNNKDYAQYKGAQKTLSLLGPLLRGEITAGRIDALAHDPRWMKKLELSMGAEGAKEIVQIARDLKKATEAIKKIPRATLHKFEDIYSIGLLIPLIKIPVAIKKGVDIAQKAYGNYLTSPAKRVALDESLKALANQDIVAYKEATDKLK